MTKSDSNINPSSIVLESQLQIEVYFILEPNRVWRNMQEQHNLVFPFKIISQLTRKLIISKSC